jgi:hypothetical protein
VIRRTNLVLAEHDGQRYLVALAGESPWAPNVRAAGGRVVSGAGGGAATLVEVPVKDRAPVIWAYLWGRTASRVNYADEDRWMAGYAWRSWVQALVKEAQDAVQGGPRGVAGLIDQVDGQHRVRPGRDGVGLPGEESTSMASKAPPSWRPRVANRSAGQPRRRKTAAPTGTAHGRRGP